LICRRRRHFPANFSQHFNLTLSFCTVF
jgi:hypothetical protein